MAAYDVRLPISRDSADGYTLVKKYKDSIKQQIKMVVLTNPGERIMMPFFGVGIRNYLFLQKQPTLEVEIRQKIYQQINTYIREVNLRGVEIRGFGPEDIDTNFINVKIHYSVPFLASSEQISIEVS